MRYFIKCFICNSHDEDCGHREPALIVWWRELNGWRPVQNEPTFARIAGDVYSRETPQPQLEAPEPLRIPAPQPRPAVAAVTVEVVRQRANAVDRAQPDYKRIPGNEKLPGRKSGYSELRGY